MPKIGTCLWFDTEAEEAAKFYVSIFENSKILDTTRYSEGAPRPKGSVMTVRFSLDGREFVALNGGPHFKFTPAISFVVPCDTQAELDYFWEKLLAGGAEQQCGWLTDQFGVSWQIVPRALLAMLNSADAAASHRAVTAMMQMKKLEISVLERAYKSA